MKEYIEVQCAKNTQRCSEDCKFLVYGKSFCCLGGRDFPMKMALVGWSFV